MESIRLNRQDCNGAV